MSGVQPVLTPAQTPAPAPAPAPANYQMRGGIESPVPAASVYDAFPKSSIPNPQMVFSGPGYNSPLPGSNPLSTLALVITQIAIIIFPLFLVSLPLSVAATIMAKFRDDIGGRAARGCLVLNLYFWAVGLVLIAAIFS